MRAVCVRACANLVITLVEVSGLLLVIGLAWAFLASGQGSTDRLLEFRSGVSHALSTFRRGIVR